MKSQLPFLIRRFARIAALSIFLAGILGLIVTFTFATSAPISQRIFFSVLGFLLIVIGAWLFKLTDNLLKKVNLPLVGNRFALCLEFLFEVCVLISVGSFVRSFSCVRPLPWMKYDIEAFGACEVPYMDCCADGFGSFKTGFAFVFVCFALYSAYLYYSKRKSAS